MQMWIWILILEAVKSTKKWKMLKTCTWEFEIAYKDISHTLMHMYECKQPMFPIKLADLKFLSDDMCCCKQLFVMWEDSIHNSNWIEMLLNWLNHLNLWRNCGTRCEGLEGDYANKYFLRAVWFLENIQYVKCEQLESIYQ